MVVNSLHTNAHPRHWLFPAGLQRATALLPLFFSPRQRWNPRLSAAKRMSIADNFLQKQQKQREPRLAKESVVSTNRLRRPRRNFPARQRSEDALSDGLQTEKVLHWRKIPVWPMPPSENPARPRIGSGRRSIAALWG